MDCPLQWLRKLWQCNSVKGHEWSGKTVDKPAGRHRHRHRWIRGHGYSAKNGWEHLYCGAKYKCASWLEVRSCWHLRCLWDRRSQNLHYFKNIFCWTCAAINSRHIYPGKYRTFSQTALSTKVGWLLKRKIRRNYHRLRIISYIRYRVSARCSQIRAPRYWSLKTHP